MSGVGVDMVLALLPEVGHGATVGHHDAVVPPLIAQDLVEQAVTAAAGVSLEAVVGAHDLLDACLLHEVLEGGQIGLPEFTEGDVLGIEAVSAPLRTRVYGKVLGAGVRLVPLRVVRSLDASYDGDAHASAQVRVFTVRLLSASPARVAEDVHVGRPEGESLVAPVGTSLVGHAVLGACFVGHGIEHLI